MRVFTLASYGVLERYAVSKDGEWTDYWQQPYNTRSADIPGGAITAIGYGHEEVRVYHVSEGQIFEFGLSTGRGWWRVGFVG